jgi:hypothetical protein
MGVGYQNKYRAMAVGERKCSGEPANMNVCKRLEQVTDG